MGSSSSSRAPAASCSDVKKQQGECAGGRKANDEGVCETFTGTDNEYDSSVEIGISFEILSEVGSDSSNEESDSESDSSCAEVDVFVDEEERTRVLAEAIALKKAAVDYAHPEVGVVTLDGAVCGRNYFNRFSAPEVEHEDIKEQAEILADVRVLKKAAVDYAHPEGEVVTSDPCVYGRNYFNRVSAPEAEDEDIEECALILAEAAALKKAAVNYAHPEVGVTTSDPCVYGRNYFDCVSASEVEDVEERAVILAEAAALKKAAVGYEHPEVGVTTSDPCVYGRNYFNRVSTPEVEDEYIEERAVILAEAAALKKAAVDYAHPEVGVTTSDPCVYGRNYFDRVSAPEVEDVEERAVILAETAALKKAAVDYAHPEVGVTTSDPCVYGRNYFSCVPPPEVEGEDIEECAVILAEAAALKKAAVDYAHPEVRVSTSDPSVYGRSYFSCLSVPEVEDEDIEEQAQILADLRVLKKAAVGYAHPEVGVTTSDPTLYGRNYFNRMSAPVVKDEYIEEREVILAEGVVLKKVAVEYAHPEVGVSTSDPIVYGRNYFSRLSVPEVEDEDIEEQAQILADLRALKKAAIDYAHPEVEVTISDPTLYGRNYFNRMSAPEVEAGDMEEKVMVLAEAIALKKAAVDYVHPEVGVSTSDPSVYGRNYYDRYGTDHPAVCTVSTKQYPSMRKERAMSNVSETFEFDDDVFNDMREEFQDMEDLNVKKMNTLRDEGNHLEVEGSQPEDEGKLSRSPSSVMLIGLVDGAGY